MVIPSPATGNILSAAPLGVATGASRLVPDSGVIIHAGARVRSVLYILFLCLLAVSLSGCQSKRHLEREARTRGAGIQRVTPAMTMKVLKTAQKQVGRPYKLGGDNPRTGFDCSGLVYWAYRQHGIIVPRRTVEQANAGMAVSQGKMRPGDIIVFRVPDAPNGLHTGLYAGNDKFVHSPNSRSRVRVENLAPYWNQRFLKARRITSSSGSR